MTTSIKIAKFAYNIKYENRVVFEGGRGWRTVNIFFKLFANNPNGFVSLG